MTRRRWRRCARDAKRIGQREKEELQWQGNICTTGAVQAAEITKVVLEEMRKRNEEDKVLLYFSCFTHLYTNV
jgi:hypothetical protein